MEQLLLLLMGNLSKISLICCYALLLLTGFALAPRWQREGTETTISWDASGYYMYLPATFIYHDLRQCRFKDSILSRYHPTPDFQQAFVHASGNYVMKYSCGQAVMMSPFFFAGHVFASASDTYPADGFSFPYQAALGIGMLLYGFLGLYFLRKVLLHYFKDGTVAWVLLLLVAGTNYLNYAAVDQGMTHSPLFALYALIAYCCVRYYASPKAKYAAALGLLTGLAALTRPSEIVCLLLPLLWGVSGFRPLKERLQFLVKSWRQILVLGLCFVLVVSVQLLYWKYVSGEWLVYSYQDQKFSWGHPHLKNYLFSPRSGWLRYSPMMLLAFAGFLPLLWRKINVFPVVLFSLLSLYIVSAWDIWDYAGTGGRAMIQSYVMLSFPIAALVEYVHAGRWLRWPFYALCLLFVYLNVWWTWHAHRGSIQVFSLTKAYYQAVVGRWRVSDETLLLLDNKDAYSRTPVQPVLLLENNFEQDTSAAVQPEGIQGRSLVLDPAHPSSPEYVVPVPKDKQWIRATADFRCGMKEWDAGRMSRLVVRFYEGTRVVQQNEVRVHRLLEDGSTRTISADARVPEVPFDRVTVSLDNGGNDKTLWVDNLRVIAFRND